MILFSEENFGTDKKSTSRLLEYLKIVGLTGLAVPLELKQSTNKQLKIGKKLDAYTSISA